MRSVVWLKRDLRLADHRPLADAAAGECLLLYVFEDSLMAAPDYDPCHRVFVEQSLRELEPRVASLGGRLLLASGEVVDALDRLYESWAFDRLLSHEETGNALSFARDRAVGAWCNARRVKWIEHPQHGVFRGLKDRDGWSARWRQRMNEPLTATPGRLRSPAVSPALRQPECTPAAREHADRQAGGERRARQVLDGFLTNRGQGYAAGMSSPVSAADACSRLSPYLAWGNLSVREVYRAAEDRAAEVRVSSPRPPDWLKSLAAFTKRLRWHCHFIQKLEDQPDIEFVNMHRACDGLREDQFNEQYFEAWKAGATGYPMVDACMRALKTQKWINFRMRAMLVSFASYHLWLDWRRTAPWLARQFLDYEPGIHYSQIQMQSGTTGINTLRIYSPAKQVMDHDPEGAFLHRWCPELAPLSGAMLANPELADPAVLSALGIRLGRSYPRPLVDHRAATRAARSRIQAVRSTEQARTESRLVLQKHGSRSRRRGRSASRRTP